MKKGWSCGIRGTAVLLALTCLFMAVSLYRNGDMQRSAAGVATENDASEPVILLDAGHGGEDGGAVGVNGVAEKTINLALVGQLGTMLTAAGVKVAYTRTEDRLLYTEEQNIYGMRKIYDLRNRLEIARQTENVVLISIHMNKFSDARQKGVQVYYSVSDPRSRALARRIRSSITSDLQSGNRRVSKPGNSSIYLLERADFPAVLVECGFLSNPEECAALCDTEYQKKLCFAMFCAIMEYISTEKGSAT